MLPARPLSICCKSCICPLLFSCSISPVLTFILQSSAVLLCNYSPMVAEHNIFLPWCNSVCLDSVRTSESFTLASLWQLQEQIFNWSSLVGTSAGDFCLSSRMTPLSYHAEDTFVCVRLCIGLCQAAGGFEDKLNIRAKWLCVGQMESWKVVSFEFLDRLC